MLNNNKSNPLRVMEASFSSGQEAMKTPAVPNSKATNTSVFNFFFKKNTDEKLMNKGLVAMASAPTPAVTSCMAIT